MSGWGWALAALIATVAAVLEHLWEMRAREVFLLENGFGNTVAVYTSRATAERECDRRSRTLSGERVLGYEVLSVLQNPRARHWGPRPKVARLVTQFPVGGAGNPTRRQASMHVVPSAEVLAEAMRSASDTEQGGGS